jgi:hypothetical protein
MTIWRMRTACRIAEDTNTHSQYVILTAFLLQHLLHEHVTSYLYCLSDLCSLLWMDEGTSGETAVCNVPTVYPPILRQ